jgi:phosphohistidine phosphatase
MKRLVICRHAKSSWNDPYLSDRERPLAPRGLRDAPEMGLRLKRRGINPDLILSSNALRALQTARITAYELGFDPNKIVIISQLYHAGPGTLLQQVKSTGPEVTTLLIFGHNPGMNDLIDFLGNPIDNLPTCGQFGILFNVEKWTDVGAANAQLWFFDYPKSKFPNV